MLQEDMTPRMIGQLLACLSMGAKGCCLLSFDYSLEAMKKKKWWKHLRML